MGSNFIEKPDPGMGIDLFSIQILAFKFYKGTFAMRLQRMFILYSPNTAA